MLNIKKLDAFRAVLESSSITGASDKLGLTQSAVSRLISNLEEELGFPLFNRIKGKIQITARGQSFYKEIEPLLNGIDQIPAIAKQIKQHQHSRLRIITLNSLAHSIVPLALKKFCANNPSTNVIVTIKSRKELIHWEGGEHFDVALASLPFEQRVFQKECFVKFTAVIVLPKEHRLNKINKIHLSDLKGENLISLDPMEIFQSSIKAYQKEYNIDQTLKIQTTSMLQAAQMVSKGIGLAIIDPFIAETIKNNDVVIRKLNPKIEYEYGYIWPSGRKLSSLTEEFISYAKEISEEISKKWR
ncbi:MAG: LysR family transcriptional regulator [Proteobacteria bacterium]|nr:LysR family transcriptional regulator [Pseudomonadota bacterium]